MTRKTFTATLLTAFLVCLAAAGNAAAAVTVDSGSVSWDAKPGYRQVLTIGGADQNLTISFDEGQAPYFQPYDADGNLLADGTYTWQLTAEPTFSKADKAAFAEARLRGESLAVQAADKRSGAFTLQGGAFVTGGPQSGDRDEAGDTKAQVFLDDLIVDGSACVGLDCASSESFGFDTLRLKENNLRIKFDDTSATGSFANNDWQLTANDSVNGGLNKFSIDDITNGKTPFTVEGNAPANALYVEEGGGDVGMGTNEPVVELHVVDGDSPTLRLEQDGSSGFTPQTWDLASNETNFFVRDVTNGSKLPFRIKPGAPTDSLFIAADGDIGMGTDSPVNPLHVKGEDGGTLVRVEDTASAVADRDMINLISNGGQLIRFVDTTGGTFWTSGANQSGDFVINGNGTGTDDLTISKSTGDVTIAGQIFTTGTDCSGGCDLVFQPEYELESIKEHATSMWQNSYLPGVGPTVENDERWNLTSKVGGILNELEKAHIYIEQLNDGLEGKDAKIASLEERLARLEALLGAE